jgi:hypothetical protein
VCMIKWERLQFLFCLKATNGGECLGNNIKKWYGVLSLYIIIM